MPNREHAPMGAPCWADLWTSDVEGSRTFYAELFGWEAQEPSPEFGGYFIFTRYDVPVSGAMGDMGDMPANNTWKVYLATNDLDTTMKEVASAGGEVTFPSMAVADLGSQALFADNTGAHLGAWQADTFEGFTVLNEHGAPGWFELFTRDFSKSIDFYRSVFHWETDSVGDTDEFRYSTMRNPDGEAELAGVMDASAFLPESAPSAWSVYWQVDDIHSAVAKLTDLGGSVVAEATDTPYGWIATVADPAGAQFKLRTPPA